MMRLTGADLGDALFNYTRSETLDAQVTPSSGGNTLQLG